MDDPQADFSGSQPRPGLTSRMQQGFRRRYQRERQMRATASLAFIMAGIWFGLPVFARVGGQVKIPENGLALANDLLPVLLTPSSFWSGITNGLGLLQAAAATIPGFTAWAGLLALTLGALLGMSWLLPTVRKDEWN